MMLAAGKVHCISCCSSMSSCAFSGKMLRFAAFGDTTVVVSLFAFMILFYLFQLADVILPGVILFSIIAPVILKYAEQKPLRNKMHRIKT